MSKLLYFIAIFAVLWFAKRYGFWAASGILLLIILFTIWKKRAKLLTVLASQAYFGKGDVQKGEKYYKAAYNTGIMTADNKISYSSFCLRENRFEKGRRLLNEVINSSRTTTEEKIKAKHNLAVLIWKQGDLDEALRILEIVHKEMPTTSTYGTLGVLYLEKAKRDSDYEFISAFLVEAYDYNGDDRTIADNLGEFYLMTKDYEKAKEIYDKLLKAELMTPMPYYNYGLVLKNIGDSEGAAEAFRKALTRRFTTVLTVTPEMIQEELDNLEKTNTNTSQE